MANLPTDKPPFTLHNRGAALAYPYKGGKWQRLQFPEGISDGLKTNWPTGQHYRDSDNKNYICQLAQQWANRVQIAAPLTNYYLDRLPDGYACFEQNQPGGPQVYKRLFGHPSGRFFDSIRRFEVHFFWLLNGREGKCECVLCGNVKPAVGPPRKRNRLDPVQGVSEDRQSHLSREQRRQHSHRPRSARENDLDHSVVAEPAGAMTERTRRNARQQTTAYPTDEEGTRHVWREGIIRLKNAEDSARGIEIDIKEEDSMDWIVERDLLKNHLTQIELQHSFIPRRGELVLWVTDLPMNTYIVRHSMTLEYKLFNFDVKKFVGTPSWRGGVVTDIPSAASKNGNIDFPDILDLPEKKTDWNTAGFRVETMPDPNDDLNKSLSKQYKYVPLRNIRPLSHWQLILKGVPQKHLHPSILYAITCMTSISLVGKWRFNGGWPFGTIMAKAAYIGSELVTIGDTIRLLPTSNSGCTEVMIVESIRLSLDHIRPHHLDQSSSTLCSESVVTLTGQAFTTRTEDAYTYLSTAELRDEISSINPEPVKPEVVKTMFRPVGTGDYGKWYPLHGPRMRFQVSYDQVLGRLYEADAVTLWSGQRQYKNHEDDGSPLLPDLSFDLSSVIAGRKYATKTDERITRLPVDEPNGIRWLISDTRVQALAVASINGLDAGAYHDIRDPDTLASWRAHIRFANGETLSDDLLAVMHAKKPSTSRNWTKDFVSSSTVEFDEKKRGRKAGSKLINGKIYSASDLANMTDAARTKLLSEAQNSSPDKNIPSDRMNHDVIEIRDSDGIEPSSPQRYRSRMAGAALGSSDEEDSADSRGESRIRAQTDVQMRQPLKSKLAVYESASADEQVDTDNQENSDSSENDPTDLFVWQSNGKDSDQPRAPLTKSQIMESVGKGHSSMVASVQQYDEYDDDDSEFGDFNLEDWKNPRNARGGTEETEGGDYQPGESQ